MNSLVFSALRVTALVFVLLITIGGNAEAQQKAAVLITQLEGKAAKTEGAKWTQINLLDELPAGTTIQIGEKSKIKVTFYSDTHAEEVQGPAVVKIGAKSLSMEKGKQKQLVTHNAYKGIKSINSIHSTGEKFGGTIVRGAPVRLSGIKIKSPRGLIISNKPSFEWTTTATTDKFVVTLEDSDQKQIFKQSVKGLKLDYPVDASPLEPGRFYLWSVAPEEAVMGMDKTGAAVKLPDPAAYNSLVSFTKEAEDRIRKNPSDTSPLVELMVVYMDFGLVSDAGKVCSRLLKLKPNDENLKQINSRLTQ